MGPTERRSFLFFFFSSFSSDKHNSWTEVAQEVQTRHADRTYTLHAAQWSLPYWLNKSAQKGGSILWILPFSILNGKPMMTRSYYGRWRSLDEAGPVSVRRGFPLVLPRISKTGSSWKHCHMMMGLQLIKTCPDMHYFFEGIKPSGARRVNSNWIWASKTLWRLTSVQTKWRATQMNQVSLTFVLDFWQHN